MRLKDSQVLENLTSPFGGIQKIEELGLLSELVKFFKEPYILRVVKPWFNEYDLTVFDLERGYSFQIFRYVNNISDFELEFSSQIQHIHTNYELNEEQVRELNRLRETNFLDSEQKALLDDLEPGTVESDELKELLDDIEKNYIILPNDVHDKVQNTDHGDFLLFHVSKPNGSFTFLVLWICRDVDPKVKENKLKVWREIANFTLFSKASRVSLDFNNLDLDLENASLKLYIRIGEWPEQLTDQNLKNSKLTEISEYKNLTVPIYIYPSSNSWILAELFDKDHNQIPISVQNTSGIGYERVITNDSSVIFVLVSLTASVAKRDQPVFLDQDASLSDRIEVNVEFEQA